MTYDEIQLWTLWVRIGALVVSILGILFVLKQLRQVGETVLGNAFSNSFAELRELHKIFIEHPDLRPYFYENEVLPQDAEPRQRQKANAVAEMFLDAFIHMHLLRPRFPDELRGHIDLFIKDMVQSSGFLADYLGQNANFIPVSLRSLILGYIDARARPS